MAKRTPLYARHAALGAKLGDFGGWDMPLHYGSQLDEHYQVRCAAGLFNVSHMTIVDFAESVPTRAPLRYLLAKDIARLYPGKALFTRWKPLVCSSPAPATLARTVWKSCRPLLKRPSSGIGLSPPASRPADWAPAIHCGWKSA